MIAGWILLFAGAGCSIAVEREDGYKQENQQKTERQEKEERISRKSEQLAEGFREIYEEERGKGEKDTLAFQQQIIQAIGEQGYAAVDTDNQINMVHPGQVQDFCESAEQGEKDSVVFFCVTDEGGWIRYDLEAQNGDIDVTESSLRWENDSPEVYIIMNLKPPHGIIRTRDICFWRIPSGGIRRRSGAKSLPGQAVGSDMQGGLPDLSRICRI